jgi:hypothetical protein
MNQVSSDAKSHSHRKGPELAKELERLAGYARKGIKRTDYDDADGD